MTQRIAAAARAARGRTGAAATEWAQSPSDPRRNGTELWQKPAALSGNRERPLGGMVTGIDAPLVPHPGPGCDEAARWAMDTPYRGSI